MTPSCISILKIAEPKLAKGENVSEWATIRIMESEPGEESESETNTAADDGPGDSALPGLCKVKETPSTRARRAAMRSVSKRGGVTSALRRGKSFTAPRRPATAETALKKSALSTSSREFAAEACSSLEALLRQQAKVQTCVSCVLVFYMQ